MEFRREPTRRRCATTALESIRRRRRNITGDSPHKVPGRIRSLLIREQFRPSLLGILVNPFYFARKGLYEHLREVGPHVRGSTLDVGCGQKPYRELFHSTRYVGLEIDTAETRQHSRADVFYDGGNFPFPDGEFDSVVSNEVLEHVFLPEPFLSEVRRVLRPGGILLLTVPFLWDEHEQPRDFARYTSFGLKNLLERNGFAVLEARKSVSDIRAVFQMMNVYLYKATRTRNRYLNLFLTILLMAPVNLAGEMLGLVTPASEDLYLDNLFLARKTDPSGGDA